MHNCQVAESNFWNNMVTSSFDPRPWNPNTYFPSCIYHVHRLDWLGRIWMHNFFLLKARWFQQYLKLRRIAKCKKKHYVRNFRLPSPCYWALPSSSAGYMLFIVYSCERLVSVQHVGVHYLFLHQLMWAHTVRCSPGTGCPPLCFGNITAPSNFE